MIGSIISHYRIIEKLGEGGMGVVYKAEDVKLHRLVALKVLPRQALATEEDRTRFAREAQAAASLSHPNVAIIHEFDEVDDPVTGGRLAFIAMEYVDGETVKQKVKDRPLPIGEALKIAIPVSEGLAEAHGKGIIHRDIKSDNIMISRSGVVKIMDFGLAEIAGRSRVTKEGMTVGTVAYMSPEQAQGEKLDQRTDIWSLGVVLYEMITGRLPFAGDYEQAIVYRILNEEPEPITSLRSNVPMELERIVKKAMQKERALRYQTASDLLADLRSVERDIKSRVTHPSVAKGPVRKKMPAKYLVMAVSGLIVLTAVLLYLWQSSKTPASVEAEKAKIFPTRSVEAAIAVLPFTSMSPGKEDEYFVDGMTESIITDLAKVPGLLVIARNSTFQYKGKSVDVKKVGEELNVHYVLEGSVQRAANQLRVNVQLIDVSTGYHLWAERYDKEMKDVFGVQDDISRHIVVAVNVALRPDQATSAALPPTKNLEAYDTFLKGLFYKEKPGRMANDSAIQMLEKAVALDPQFALAHAHLAGSYTHKYFSFDPRKEWEQKAFVSIQKALSLNPELPEAYMARGDLTWTLSNRFPHEAAIKDYRRALELNPNLSRAHFALGRTYHHIGLLARAVEELDIALRIDPNNLSASNQRAMVYLSQGQYEKVLSEWEKQPTLATYLRYAAYTKVLALDYFGRKKEALALVAEALKQGSEDEVAFAAHAVLLAGMGDHGKAEEQIAQAIRLGQGKGHFHHVQYFIGAAYALMGKKDEAIDWLQKAADDGFPCYPLYERDQYLNNVRGDLRFVSFMEKLRKQWEYYRTTLSSA